MNSFFDCLYKLSNIKRFPTHRVNQTQNVAAHSFNAVLIALYIADVDKIECDKAILLQKGLFHDFVEGKTGDIAAPTRERNPDFYAQVKQLEEDVLNEIFNGLPVDYRDFALNCKKGVEGELITLGDLIERLIYLSEERRSGNTSIDDVYGGTLKRIKTKEMKALLKKYPTGNELLLHYLSAIK